MTVDTLLKRLGRVAVWTVALVVPAAGTGHAMGIVQSPGTQDVWRDVRRELSADQNTDGFSTGLRQVLERVAPGSDNSHLMALSYSVAKPAEIDALDEFWTRHMANNADQVGFSTMLDVRARVLGMQTMDRQTYLKDWLYLAKGGAYECGGNCGNGNGNGGGNGSGNEGGGNG